MALKRLKVKLAAPSQTETDSIPTICIEGDLMKQFIVADKQVKDGKALMEDLRPDILEIGLDAVFTRSCKRPTSPTTTVKIQDDEGEVVQFQFVNKYGAIPDTDAADELFDTIVNGDGETVDINYFVQETVKATFSDKVFYDAEGNFTQAIYDKFRLAIGRVAKELGVDNPLETEKVVIPKAVFHEERFKTFPKAETQVRLFEVMPNQVRLVPVTVKGNGKKK